MRLSNYDFGRSSEHWPWSFHISEPVLSVEHLSKSPVASHSQSATLIWLADFSRQQLDHRVPTKDCVSSRAYPSCSQFEFQDTDDRAERTLDYRNDAGQIDPVVLDQNESTKMRDCRFDSGRCIEYGHVRWGQANQSTANSHLFSEPVARNVPPVISPCVAIQSTRGRTVNNRIVDR